MRRSKNYYQERAGRLKGCNEPSLRPQQRGGHPRSRPGPEPRARRAHVHSHGPPYPPDAGVVNGPREVCATFSRVAPPFGILKRRGPALGVSRQACVAVDVRRSSRSRPVGRAHVSVSAYPDPRFKASALARWHALAYLRPPPRAPDASDGGTPPWVPWCLSIQRHRKRNLWTG